jgi:aspartate/methionine/tyrosine aminotransferase
MQEGLFLKLSPNASNIKYAIRDIVISAKQVERQSGKKLYYFNIGDPNKFDFYYTDSAGDPGLRQEIVLRQKRLWGTSLDSDHVLVTTGVSEAISFVAASMAPGTEVLVPSPLYPSYLSYFRFHNVVPIQYYTREFDGWQPDVDDIGKKINEKTQAILIINPNNPTGAVYSPKVIKQMTDLAGEHNLLVISDEIYDLLSFDNSFRSVASLTDIPVLELNGISKTLLSPGWRLGWATLRDDQAQFEDFWELLAKQSRIRLCAGTPIQVAVRKVLNREMRHIPGVIEKLKQRSDYFTKRINAIEGLSVSPPNGAFYVFPRIEKEIDDRKFALDLLRETGVLFVFGSGFGELGVKHFRSVVLPQIEVMEEALDHVESFVQKIK